MSYTSLMGIKVVNEIGLIIDIKRVITLVINLFFVKEIILFYTLAL